MKDIILSQLFTLRLCILARSFLILSPTGLKIVVEAHNYIYFDSEGEQTTNTTDNLINELQWLKVEELKDFPSIK